MDISSSMKVLAVDPGGSTGMALYQGNGEMIEHYEAWAEPEPMRAITVARNAMRGGDADVIVCESFTIGAGTLKKSRAGTSVTIEMIGALRWLTHFTGKAFVLQPPADAVRFSSDEKLKRLGWWSYNDHARSATRHLVLYLARSGLLGPDRLIGLPVQGGGV